jgi:hypothetical protein
MGIIPKTRETRRKRICQDVFEKVFQSQPVLLDEFRWEVFCAECGELNDSISYSFLKSFQRTLRVFHERIKTTPTAPPLGLPFGIVARSAVFRIPSRSTIRKFKSLQNATISFVGVQMIRQSNGRLIPHLRWHFYVENEQRRNFSILGDATVSMVINKPLVVVSDVRQIGNVLQGQNFSLPWQTSGTDRFEKVKQARRAADMIRALSLLQKQV